MAGWQAINDEFYTRSADRFIAAWWNGVTAGNHGKQECRFLTDEARAFGPQYALSAPWVDKAKRFDGKAEAEAFLQLQNETRPSPLGDGWFVCAVGALEAVTGYRPNTKAAIIGDDEETSALRF